MSKLSFGSLASVFIHVVLLSGLVFRLPDSNLEPEQPKAIKVELIPAPELAPPKDKKVEAAVPPPLPKTEPDKVEQAKIQPPKILRPVYKFAEKDSEEGKTKDIVGDRGEEVKNARPEQKTQIEPDKPDLKSQPNVDTQPTLKPELLTPEPEPTLQTPKLSEPTTDSTSIALASVKPAKPNFRPKRKAPKKTRKVKSSKSARLRPSKKQTAATTAKGNLARGLRAGKLCVTELRSQLNNSIPPRWPDRLPTYRLTTGNVLQVRRSAFRENARWVNLQFRCEVDRAVTKVVAFQLKVGTPVPRSQWRKRGLPGS